MKIDLKNFDVCPLCGHKLKRKKTESEARREAARENGKKGGRPVNPESKRQRKLRDKAAKENAM